MKKRDELSNPDSCMSKAALDEPVFVLRANDPLAPEVVRLWASLYTIAKRNENGGTVPDECVRKAAEAVENAVAMEAWQYHQASGCPRQFEFPGGLPPA